MFLTWISLLLIMTRTFSVLCLGPSCVTLIRLHYGAWVQVVMDCTMELHVFVQMFLLAITRLRRRMGQKSSPQNNPTMQMKATLKWPTAIPLLVTISLSVVNLGDSTKRIFIFVCKHNSQELMMGANYSKHVLQFFCFILPNHLTYELAL